LAFDKLWSGTLRFGIGKFSFGERHGLRMNLLNHGRGVLDTGNWVGKFGIEGGALKKSSSRLEASGDFPLFVEFPSSFAKNNDGGISGTQAGVERISGARGLIWN
jgi:hypothetical protein